MRLEFDIGNTNHKWRLLDRGEVVRRGSFSNSEDGLAGCPHQGVEVIWVACVAHARFVDAIAVWAKQYNIEVQQAIVTEQASGVVCGYEQPQRLGVDRWLAVLAAYYRYGPTCVIDIGSAMTLDVVDVNGHHLGGYIVPGYQLLLNALFKDTEKVRWAESEVSEALSLGRNTANAVVSGVKLMLVGFVEQAIARLPVDHTQIVFTGGGGRLLREACGDRGLWIEDLVFEGLALAQREVVS
ncbi:MAG TPA: type III pantothenate kinase [Pseudomonadales bacterium]|nr:type III pantothenate kinase [Pseudomonadales bacterium]